MVNFVWRERWVDCRCLRSPKKHLFAVCILRCIFRLTSFVGLIRDPRYTNSLTTSNCLSPVATIYPTSYILSFFHLFLTQLWLLLFPMLSKLHVLDNTESFIISNFKSFLVCRSNYIFWL
jgi:hypothetical protein